MDTHAQECLDFPRIRELLASHALTGLGKSLAAQIQPITRPQMVQRWLSQVEELRRLAEDRGLPPFGGITDVRDVVKRSGPPLRISADEMSALGDALAATGALVRHFENLPEGFPELAHLAGRIGNFESVANRIRSIVDARGEVRDDASPKLQRLRRDVDNARKDINAAIERLLRDQNIRRILQYPKPTVHGDRIVLPLRTEYRGRLPGVIHRTSDSGATAYVEPAQAVELNNHISNLRVEEHEECNRLLWDLAHEVHLNENEILRTLDTLAVVDLIAAKVRFAKAYNLRCPQINEDGKMKVRAARHPLLVRLQNERRAAGDEFEDVVPIDYRLGDDFDMLVITGPNTGGKTVTLKTLGLINLMVQSGLPVPVEEGSELTIFNDVLIDIGDEQSMQQSLSTFSAHLKRLLDMLRKASSRTLVLIDELGAGTDPDEGAAIGRAVLDELLRLGARCVVTTHLGALKAFSLARERSENASVEFDTETLRPTYHLRIGESGSSNAIDVAQRLGMPKRLAMAARKNMSRQARQLGAALRGTSRAKREAEDARKAAESAQIEANRAQGEAHVARSRLEQQKAEFHAWVQRVVHLQPGDAVRVRNFDRDGRVVRLRLEQQRAEVDVGAYSVEVPLADVLPPETVPPPPAFVATKPAPAPQPKRPPRKPAPAQHGEDARRQRPPHKGTPRQHAGQSAPGAPRERQAPPPPPPLTDEEVEALEQGDAVYVKRFHREGVVARVKPAQRVVAVSVGLLEVEVPYAGLGRPRSWRAPKQPKSEPRKPADKPAEEKPDA